MNKTLFHLAIISLFLSLSSCSNTPKKTDLHLKIEKIIGFEIPYFDLISSEEGPKSFNGDYSNEYHIKFKKEVDLSQFYKDIDYQIKNPKLLSHHEGSTQIILDEQTALYEQNQSVLQDQWSLSQDGQYSYSYWAEGDEDIAFSLDINPKDSTAEVKYGNW